MNRNLLNGLVIIVSWSMAVSTNAQQCGAETGQADDMVRIMRTLGRKWPSIGRQVSQSKSEKTPTINAAPTPPIAPSRVRHVQAVEPIRVDETRALQIAEPTPAQLPAPVDRPSTRQLDETCGPDCEVDPNEPSPCEACEQALSASESLTRELDDADKDEILNAQPPESSEPSKPSTRARGLKLGPIQRINFDGAFEPLEKLTDEFQPQDIGTQGDRDPYFGTPNRFEHHWTARNLAHRSLFFEDMPLERYGWAATPTKQAFCSAAHFFKDALLLPLRKCKEQDKCELHYVLGYERPGTCAPRIKETICPAPSPGSFSRFLRIPSLGR